MDEFKAHKINVNVAGAGSNPIISLWCMTCLETIADLRHINSLDDVLKAVREHDPYRNEALARVLQLADELDEAPRNQAANRRRIYRKQVALMIRTAVKGAI